MKRQFIRTNCWGLITDNFIDKAFNAYHYSLDQEKLFREIAMTFRGCIKDQEAAELLFFDNYVDVVYSLGERLDILINKYEKSGKLLEALMLTNIASAALMEGYKSLEPLAKEHLQSEHLRYCFWGSKELPAESLSTKVKEFTQVSIKITEGNNLLPTQSVVYRMIPACKKGSVCDTCQNTTCEFSFNN